MGRLTCFGAALTLIALATCQAEARTIVVDPGNPQGFTLSGYCDLNGDDCNAKSLGFSVELGGSTYNSYVMYGDGAITFGNTAVSSGTILSATTLADYGVPIISSGIDNTTSMFNSLGFQQAGYIFESGVHNGVGTLGAIFTSYIGTGSNSHMEESEIDITAYANKLDVKLYSYVNQYIEGYGFSDPNNPTPYTMVDPQIAGYSIANVGDVEQQFDASINNGFLEYSIPATVTFDQTGAAPEPPVWMLMIAGLGMTGFALRSRRLAQHDVADQPV